MVAGAATFPFWVVATVTADLGSLGDALSSLASPALVGAAAMMNGKHRLLVGGVSYWMAMAWIAQFPAAADPGWATAGYAILGLGALVGGRLGSIRLLTIAGAGTIALAVGKLILVDLATAGPVIRIGLALGIGLALLVVGYWIGDAELVAGADEEANSVAELLDDIA